MEVKDIIRKTELEESEMMYVIEQYIKVKKGIDIKISSCRHQFQLFKMNSAYDTACEYFFKQEEA